MGLLIVYFFYNKQWVLAIISLFILIGLAARGPLICAILIIFLIFSKRIIIIIKRMKIKKIKITPNKIIVPTSLLMVSLFLFWKYYNSFQKIIYETFADRFSGIFQNFDSSVMGRFDRLVFSFENIFSSFSSLLFGYGIGSFGLMYTGEDINDYPHNIFIESWFELDILGLLLSLIVFIIPLFFNSRQIFKYLAGYNVSKCATISS